MIVLRSAGLIVGIAVVLSGLGSSPAVASSVALSVNEISAFQLSFSSTNSFSGFTFSNSTAASESGGTGSSSFQDAPASCVGDCAGWTNEFFAHTSITEFSYGDAQIKDIDVLAGTGAASSIGEALVIDGFAHASGSNVMTANFSVAEGTTINFAFTADPLLDTLPGAGVASAAAANLFFNITISDNSGTVFSWSPDGASGGITGGTESADPFSLNLGISGDSSYDPLSSNFAAQTAGLHENVSYTLNIKMENQVNASSTVVPLPAAIWIFASGLLGLTAVARRRS